MSYLLASTGKGSGKVIDQESKIKKGGYLGHVMIPGFQSLKLLHGQKLWKRIKSIFITERTKPLD